MFISFVESCEMPLFSVKEEDLSKEYKAKFNMVYAKILCNCQEYVKACERAIEALSDSQVR